MARKKTKVLDSWEIEEWEQTKTRLRILETRIATNGAGIDWIRYCAKDKEEVADWLSGLVSRVWDETRCNNSCKWMYFCDLKKGHKGKHNDSGLVWD